MHDPHPPFLNPLCFTESEIDLLGRTADAMSAWMGKPILAQIIDATETGYEWVVYALPLLPEQDPAELSVVQVGGPDVRLIGNRGGLPITDEDVYLCEYLWAIQLCALPGVRYIKIDQDGEEIAWASELREILPFDVIDQPLDDTGSLDSSDPDDPELPHTR